MMLKALVPLALVGSCLAPTTPSPTISFAACGSGTARPTVEFYVVGRGHTVAISGVGAPIVIANPTTPRSRSGDLVGYWDDNGRTVTIGVRVDDGPIENRTLWATRPCVAR
jgi:hypothetical protein